MVKHKRSLVILTLLAAGAAGTAVAGGGDNGMNPFYGDSWAALQGNGVNLGGASAMPGANAAHPDLAPHYAWQVAPGMQHTQGSMASGLQRAQAPAANAERTQSTLASHAAPPAVRQIDPFEDKGGS